MELTDTELEQIEQRGADRLIEMLVVEMVESGEPRTVFYDHANSIVDAVFTKRAFNIAIEVESIAQHHAEYLLSQMDIEQIRIFLHDAEARKTLIRGKR